MTRVERVLDHLVEAVPRAIRQAGLKPNACILASRLGIEALRVEGLRARAVPVILTVGNPTYMDLLVRADPGTADEWRDAGAWGIELGRENPSNLPGWNGHLVVVVQDRYLLDLTAHQISRPQKGIVGKAFWIEARDFARGEPCALEAGDGCTWLYRHDPENREYLRLPAWSGFRIARRAGCVISERSAPLPGGMISPEVRVPLLGARRR